MDTLRLKRAARAQRRPSGLAALLAAGACLLSSCGGSDPSVGNQDITFALAFDAHPATPQGGESSAAVSVVDEDAVASADESQAFDAAVALRLVGPMPPGISADFDRATLRPTERAAMVVSATEDAQPGLHQLLVAGQISGGSTTRYFSHTVSVTGSCAAATEPIRDVFASRSGRTVAVTRSGAVYVWGHNAVPFPEGAQALAGASPVPSALAFYAAQPVGEIGPTRSAASVGGTSAFVLYDGSMRVLSRYFRSDVGAPGGQAGWHVHQAAGAEGWVQVVADQAAYFALRNDGTVWRFFAAAATPEGQLQFAPPQQVGGFADVARLAAGARHLLALRRDGTVLARGANDHGQIGDGSDETAQAPLPVPGLVGIVDVAAGDDHSLALHTDGTVLAWGRGDQGQLGHGFASGAGRPVEVVMADGSRISGVIALAAGSNHSLAQVSDATVWAWGSGSAGQLGNGTNAGSLVAARVAGVEAERIHAGGNASFSVVFARASVEAWGENDQGQLGDGSVLLRTQPTAALGLGQGEGIDCRTGDAAATQFSDTEFAEASWQAIVVATPLAGPEQSAVQSANGGNPLAWRRMTHRLLAPAAEPLFLTVVHLKLDAVYRPAQSGAILGLDFSEDRILLPGTEGPARPPAGHAAFMQAGRLYVSNVAGDFDGGFEVGQWTSATWRNLMAPDFSMVAGPPCAEGEQCPDFTPRGEPITFGYQRQSLAGSADPRFTVEHGIDNWRVTVQVQPLPVQQATGRGRR